jgi:ribosome maturation factor RimP
MGARRPFFLRKDMLVPDVRRTEKTLQREVTQQVESGLPGVEVLAVELVSPHRFCVYVDHPAGVDHALCERVTNVLRTYLDRYSVDVSSPGLERPLRKPAHFANVVGRRVAIRTEQEIAGRKRFRGQVLAADEQGVSLGAEGGQAVLIPYADVVRGNVIHEG